MEVGAPGGGRRLLFGQLRRQWGGLLVGVLLALVWTGTKVAVPSLVQRGIDQGVEGGDGDALLRWSLIIAVAGVVGGVCSGARRYCAFREARRAETALRDQLYAHLQHLHPGYHDRTQTGQLMSRANTDLQQVQNFLVMIPLTMANGVIVLASVVLLFTMHVQLAFAALVGVPLIVVLARRFASRLHPAMMDIQNESAELASVVEETVAGVRIVKGFGAEPVQAGRLRDEADDVYEASMEAAGIRGRYFPALELLPNAALVVVLGYGGHLVLDGRLSIGQLVAFNVYLALMVWPLRMIGNIIASGQRAMAASQRVYDVLATPPSITDAPNARARTTGGAGTVRFEGVGFRYGPGPRVLDAFDLEIEPGTSIALVGATGSGKTTVARLIPRFYEVEEGRVLLDGVDVRQLRLHDLRRAVATVFEETFLFSDSIAVNIAFGAPDASAGAIERAARLAGIHDFVSTLPDGYGTEIGERGFSLSGGQRQRIAIARAILAEPSVLILDDATSAVDPSKEHEIRGALDQVMRGRTTIVIAHRPATIALADRVVLIDEGRVAATGSHTDLLQQSERYRQVLASAARADAEVDEEEKEDEVLTA